MKGHEACTTVKCCQEEAIPERCPKFSLDEYEFSRESTTPCRKLTKEISNEGHYLTRLARGRKVKVR